MDSSVGHGFVEPSAPGSQLVSPQYPQGYRIDPPPRRGVDRSTLGPAERTSPRTESFRPWFDMARRQQGANAQADVRARRPADPTLSRQPNARHKQADRPIVAALSWPASPVLAAFRGHPYLAAVVEPNAPDVAATLADATVDLESTGRKIVRLARALGAAAGGLGIAAPLAAAPTFTELGVADARPRPRRWAVLCRHPGVTVGPCRARARWRDQRPRGQCVSEEGRGRGGFRRHGSAPCDPAACPNLWASAKSGHGCSAFLRTGESGLMLAPA